MTDTIYTYDDISLSQVDETRTIIYDEPCFAYDGGYDLICLYGLKPLPKRRIVGGGGGLGKTTEKKTYPEPDIVELVFKTKIVNFDIENTKTYKYDKNSNVTVEVKDFKINLKKTNIKSEIIKRVGINPVRITSNIEKK